jgi:hypothetical protein
LRAGVEKPGSLTISAVGIQAPDRIGGTHKNLDISENPPDSSVESNLKSQISNLKSTSAVAIPAPDRIGGTHKNLDISENPPDSSVESNLKSQISNRPAPLRYKPLTGLVELTKI